MNVSLPTIRISLILSSILITLSLFEVGLRIVDKPKSPISGWRAVNVNPVEQNRLGYRGQQIEYSPGDFVIVLLGDSSVEAQACAYEWMPERRLEYHLGKGVKVFSIGASGYGQDQELLALREYFEKYRADLVVLWETPPNDVWNNLFPSIMPLIGTPKPTFQLVNGKLEGPTELIGQPIRETSRFKLVQLVRRVTGWSRDHLWTYPPPYKPLQSYQGETESDWQTASNTNEYFTISDLDAEKSDVAIFLSPRSPRMQYGIELTRKLIGEIQQTANAHGAKLVTFIHSPSLPNNDGVQSLNGRYYVISAKQAENNIEEINQGFEFYKIPVTVEQWRVGPQNGHLNEHANDQVMASLASQIQKLIH